MHTLTEMSTSLTQEEQRRRRLDSLDISPSTTSEENGAFGSAHGSSDDADIDTDLDTDLDISRRSTVPTKNSNGASASPSALRSRTNSLPPRRKTYPKESQQTPAAIVDVKLSETENITDDGDEAGNSNVNNKGSLQDRVDELETKLAVLSMLLQRSLLRDGAGSGALAGGLSPTSPLSPPPQTLVEAAANNMILLNTSMDISRNDDDEDDNDDDDNDSTSSSVFGSGSASRHSRSSIIPHLESPAPFSAGKTPPRSHRFNNGMDSDDDEPPSPPLGVPVPASQEYEHEQNGSSKHSQNNTSEMLSNLLDAAEEPSTPPRANGSRLKMQLSAEQQHGNSSGKGKAEGEGGVGKTMASLFQRLSPTRSRKSFPATSATVTAPTSPDTLPPPPLPRPVSSNKRNLSFRLLYDGEEAEYQQEKKMQTAPPALSSLTLAERSWLRPKILQFSKEQREQAARDAEDQLEQQQQQQLEQDDTVRNKWLNYLNSFQESTPDVDVQMQEFIKVPGMVEHVMGFGMFICLDSFLYMVTILPIRFVWSCFLLLLHLVCSWKQKPVNPAFQFHRRHTYQMIQVTILYTIYRYVLSAISIGKLYHWIRGQAMIKIYVIMAIVEVFDRLMCSLGQDCLDSMYWNSVSRPRSSRMIISVLVVLVYSTIHAVILFVHVETLNVAMNSADQALLTLLISGNFAEIKSTVFKKYNKPALFKITAADVCERFKLSLFLSLVLLLNMCQGMDASMFYDYMRICGIIWFAEVLADWIKHSFITKVSETNDTATITAHAAHSLNSFSSFHLAPANPGTALV
jgi:hypothetical protein